MKVNVLVDIPNDELCYTDRVVCRYYSEGVKDRWCSLFDRHVKYVGKDTTLLYNRIKKCPPCIKATQAQLDGDRR